MEQHQSKKELLDTLGQAISDVGYWTWWVSDFPNLMQIEFGGTQLYFSPGEGNQAPSSQIAIQFGKPKSISFLTKMKWQEMALQIGMMICTTI
jgi:hypothetical protein